MSDIIYNINKDTYHLIGFEYRKNIVDKYLDGFFGNMMLSSNKDIFFYIGAGIPIFFEYGPISFFPNFSISYYQKGRYTEDLGYRIEFKSEVEIIYNFQNNYSLSVGFFHISNANLGAKNPGVEAIKISLGVPIFVLKNI